MRTVRVLRTGIAVPLISCVTFLLLIRRYPVYSDGFGPMPSFFYFGKVPTMLEYRAHHWRYDFLILLPYVVVSLFLVWLAVYVAPKLSNRIDRSRITLGVVAFGLIVAAALINDGIARLVNRGGIVLSPEPRSLLSFIIVAVPVVLLSSMIARESLQGKP